MKNCKGYLCRHELLCFILFSDCVLLYAVINIMIDNDTVYHLWHTTQKTLLSDWRKKEELDPIERFQSDMQI